MSLTTSHATPHATLSASKARPRQRRSLRWLISFAGFPIGGLASMIISGPVDHPVRAVVGGLITGLVIGVAQAWALRFDRRPAVGWTAVTAVALAVGLTTGASTVGFATTLPALAVQGAISGAVVGLAETIVLRHLGVGRLAYGWPLYLGAVWALGWTVTTMIGVDVERHYTTFGSAGAVTVAALTLVLPIFLRRTRVATLGGSRS